MVEMQINWDNVWTMGQLLELFRNQLGARMVSAHNEHDVGRGQFQQGGIAMVAVGVANWQVLSRGGDLSGLG